MGKSKKIPILPLVQVQDIPNFVSFLPDQSMSEYTYDWTTLTEDEMTTYPIEFPIEFTLEPQTKAQVNQVFGVCNEYRIYAK